MYYTPEPQPQEAPIVETYRGCNICEYAYECLFYSAFLPDGRCAGAETIEEVKEMIDDFYAKNPAPEYKHEARGWIHSSWIMPSCKNDMMRRMAKHGCAFKTAPEGYNIYPPLNRVFALKWAKMYDGSWKIIEFCYKII